MLKGRAGEMAAMYVILWEFRVPAERRAAFESAYGPDGAWGRLFAQAAGFLGLDLLRCGEQAGRYVTIDRWQSRDDFDAFKRDFAAPYAALDRELEGLSGVETRLGAFDGLALDRPA
jgi:heme-degrading monooxygenase HmoA